MLANGQWPLVKIRDIATVYDGPHATPKKIDRGPIFLGISSLNRGRLDLEISAHLSEEDFKKWTRRVTPQPGDVVFSYETRLGEAAIIPEGLRCCLGRRMGLVRPDKKKLDTRFFLYQFLGPSFQAFLKSRIIPGSTVERILLTEFPDFLIYLPPIEEQKAIAELLGYLDDKIDINRQMNHTLEAMAQAIFKSWFVDFDPVTAKADGRQPYGMNAETAALFPSRFVESELGAVPEGWKLGSIVGLAKYVNGKNFTKNATGTGRMVIRIAELNSGPGSSTIYNDVAASAENTAYPGDLLFSWSGSLDVYRWHRDEALVNQHIFKVIPNSFPQWFVYFHLEEAMPFFQGIAADKATTMGHIKREHLSQAQLPSPPGHVIEAANRIVAPLYEKIHHNERESMTLEAIRDTLLLKLLSGEIRPNQAEKLVEEVA